MPANKNALIRYKTIDNCLRNRYRRWTLDDLVDACSEALYDMDYSELKIILIIMHNYLIISTYFTISRSNIIFL